MPSYWVRSGPPAIYEQIPDKTAVFDPETGETHYVSELPALLLSCVVAEPASHEMLISRLAGPVELDKKAVSQVLATLLYLEAAELVESRLTDAKPAN